MRQKHPAGVFIDEHNVFGIRGFKRLVALADAIGAKIITPADLYLQEKDVVAKLEGSSLLKRWQAFRNLTQVTPSDHGRVILAKKRYIDPRTAEGRRASQLDEEFSRDLSGFLSYSFCYPLEGC